LQTGLLALTLALVLFLFLSRAGLLTLPLTFFHQASYPSPSFSSFGQTGFLTFALAFVLFFAQTGLLALPLPFQSGFLTLTFTFLNRPPYLYFHPLSHFSSLDSPFGCEESLCGGRQSEGR